MSAVDLSIIVVFFLLSVGIAYIPKIRKRAGAIEYLLAGRNVPLLIFLMANVSSWYGGILGVGEFTYRFGLLNWFTQGFPYYLFAVLFALFLVDKIKNKKLITVPDAIAEEYGTKPAVAGAVLVYVLTSPAPYLLMIAIITAHILSIPLWAAVIGTALIIMVYLLAGGFRSNLFIDVFFFFVMFIAFGITVWQLYMNYGGLSFISANVPPAHLNLLGDAQPGYIIVWWLIAVWTFADPGFYQRVQSARSAKIAKYGVLLSVVFWFIFDFLTNSMGLYSRALLPGLKNPAESFLFLADEKIGSGLRGVFYIGLFATILSTLNSFFFISATTFANDIIGKGFALPNSRSLDEAAKEKRLILNTRIGLVVTAVLSSILAIIIPSVINLWYVLGSLCIPGIVFVLLSTYFPKWKITPSGALVEISAAFTAGAIWWQARELGFAAGWLANIEPMIAGLFTAFAIHIIYLLKKRFSAR